MKVSEIVNYLIRLYNTETKMINDFPEDRRITVALVGKPGKVCIPYIMRINITKWNWNTYSRIGKSMSALEASKRLAIQSGCRFIHYNKDNMLSEKDWSFIDFRLSECEPVDLLGKLMQIDKVVVYIPFKWIVTLSRSRGTLLLD